MNKIIVFGNCLQNTVGLVRSLGEVGYMVDLLFEPCQRSDCFIRLSKYVRDIYYLDDINDAIDVLLDKYGEEKEKSIILCGSDHTISLLDQNYDRLKNKFYVFNANAEQGRISKYIEKANTFLLAEECGLTVIKTYVLTKGDKLPSDIIYPCFMKGANSVKSTKADIHICDSHDEVALNMRPGVVYLVQEYIKKDYELNIIGFSYNHGAHVLLPGAIRKVRESLARQGEYMVLEDISRFPDLNIDGIKQFVKQIGYEGIFSVEFMCQGNKYYFLEINLRNDGLGYIYTAAGANYPLLWTLYVKGELTENHINRLDIKMPFYVMHENDIYNLVEGKVSLWQWMKDFHRSDAFLIMNRRDPMPFIGSTLIHVRQACKKVFRKVLGINVH